MKPFTFFDRDLSWLSFNERVLSEAANPDVPLVERIKFLSIYSSNLDEFYRVRVPAILALEKIQKETSVYQRVADIVDRQQRQFGSLLVGDILPALKKQEIKLVYNEDIPTPLLPAITDYFFNEVAGFLHLSLLGEETGFFPENNQLYTIVVVKYPFGKERIFLVNIPADHLPRFLKISLDAFSHIIFLEDIIRANLHHLFPSAQVEAVCNLKITRDAALELEDEYGEDLAEKMEKQLSKREAGLATRLLYEPGLPLRYLQSVIKTFNLQKASIVEGGRYHHLKDLARIPVSDPALLYDPWQPLDGSGLSLREGTLFNAIGSGDVLINVPYQSYNPVLRFFNEAAIDASVTEVYTTLYRVASDSRIVHALISAAKNGKKVTVLVELKARFDEANNIRWAKRMKAAGVRILYSANALKVHAKVALVKRKDTLLPYLGLLATGNFNETTAGFYTDHILLTAHQSMLSEVQQLFSFLLKRKKPDAEDAIEFRHLLVAQFNLISRFAGMIEREINHALAGRPASIIIKMNNLEEEGLITRLYEASNAGVKIQLIVRGICRLVPGVKGQSEHIKVVRIIDRYLEHGRIFIFNNNGDKEVYLGSADWMNRNIYRRIEVCFPLYDDGIKNEVLSIIEWQLKDKVQAVFLDEQMAHKKEPSDPEGVASQKAIYQWLAQKSHEISL